MYSSQIHRALAEDPYAGSYFLGVFPRDQLPEQIPHFPFSVVANTDPASKPGQHWVAFHVDEDGTSEYFDSYGDPPLKMSLFNFFFDKRNKCGDVDLNGVRIQGADSDVCGHYCIAYLTKRARGLTLAQIVDSYKGPSGAHDERVRKTVNNDFNIAPLQQHGSGFWQQPHVGCCVDQCCCSKNQCHTNGLLSQSTVRAWEAW